MFQAHLHRYIDRDEFQAHAHNYNKVLTLPVSPSHKKEHFVNHHSMENKTNAKDKTAYLRNNINYYGGRH